MKKIAFLIQLTAAAILVSPLSYADDDDWGPWSRLDITTTITLTTIIRNRKSFTITRKPEVHYYQHHRFVITNNLGIQVIHAASGWPVGL